MICQELDVGYRSRSWSSFFRGFCARKARSPAARMFCGSQDPVGSGHACLAAIRGRRIRQATSASRLARIWL